MARFYDYEVFHITPEVFNEIDDLIQACRQTGRNLTMGMNALAMLMAYTNLAIAREMSEGPRDPRQRYPKWAWQIPVRRIKETYFKGWKVRRLAAGVWMLYNDSREAWYIEFGIHPSGYKVEARGGKYYMKGSRRVRRPIRKLSLKKTLRFVDQSRAGQHVWEQIHAPFRGGSKRYVDRGDLILHDMPQSVSGMRFL